MTDLFSMLSDLDDSHKQENRNEIIKAPFGWVGGKSRSIEYLMPKLPYRNSFIDVFGGSGVVTLNRRPSRLDVYNDRYSGVTSFYRVIQDHEKMKRLVDRLEHTVHSREEFLFCRDNWDAHTIDDVERAARWYYMIQSSFISKGQQWARSTNVASPIMSRKNLTLFPMIHLRFKNIQVDNLDWKRCMEDYDSPNAVFYCDPPYLNTDSGIYDFKFKYEDHVKLLEMIHNHVQGFVAVSSYKNDLYESYPWDERHEWQVRVTALAQAYTETNCQVDTGDRGNMLATEVLYIKEVKI